MQFNHISVLLNECIEYLNIKPDGIYVDGTLGKGGHSYHICEKLSKSGRLIGIDQDTDALEAAKVTLTPFSDKVTLVHSNFSEIEKVLQELNLQSVDGILFDLGVSSYQLDNEERGFSYMHDGKLDMRMDRTACLTASDVVNTYTENELSKVIFDYGEERWAKRIAKFIVEYRQQKDIETTLELSGIIKAAVPKSALKEAQHPAKRTFQAIRIEVNAELAILKQSIEDCLSCLSPGGRIAVITFHSLEDRIVKKTFKELELSCTCPPTFPICVCKKESMGVVVTRKPVNPTNEDVELNHRARSAKLRVFQKA